MVYSYLVIPPLSLVEMLLLNQHFVFFSPSHLNVIYATVPSCCHESRSLLKDGSRHLAKNDIPVFKSKSPEPPPATVGRTGVESEV